MQNDWFEELTGDSQTPADQSSGPPLSTTSLCTPGSVPESGTRMPMGEEFLGEHEQLQLGRGYHGEGRLGFKEVQSSRHQQALRNSSTVAACTELKSGSRVFQLKARGRARGCPGGPYCASESPNHLRESAEAREPLGGSEKWGRWLTVRLLAFRGCGSISQTRAKSSSRLRATKSAT